MSASDEPVVVHRDEVEEVEEVPRPVVDEGEHEEAEELEEVPLSEAEVLQIAVDGWLESGGTELSYSYNNGADPSVWISRLAATAASLPQRVTEDAIIDLSGNELKPAPAQVLARELLPHLARYETLTLDLNNNRVSGSGCKAITAALASACGKSLVSLDMNENLVGDHGAYDLAQLLQRTPRLMTLSIGSNGFSPAGMPPLAVAVRSSSLRKLSLEFNAIGDAGVATLAPALAACTTLVWLSLSDNSIGSAGAREIAKLLHPNACGPLLHLDISVNVIKEEGAAALAEALRGSAIQHLDIGCNPIGAEGGLALARAAAVAPRLTLLDLISTDLSPEALDQVVTSMHARPSLKVVRIANNDVSEEVGREVVRMCMDPERQKAPVPRLFGRQRYMTNRTAARVERVAAVAALVGAVAAVALFARRATRRQS